MSGRRSLSWAKKVLSAKRSAPKVPGNSETQTVSASIVQLPHDVIDLIIREIPKGYHTPSKESMRTMCQCALVSRSFRSIIQPCLFSRVFIESSNRCFSFLCVLLNNNDIQKYVKELYIHDESCDEKTCPLSSPALPHILNTLATCGTLHSLQFRCIDNGLVEYDRRHKLLKGSILALYGGKYRGISRNDNDSLESQSATAYTSQGTGKLLSDVRWRKAINDSRCSLPSRINEFASSSIQRGDHPIKSLGLGGLESMNVFNFLQGSYSILDMTGLSQLTVYSVDPRTLAAVSRVIEHSGSSLERILIRQPTKLDYWLAESLPQRSLDLSVLEKLHDFAFLLRQQDHLGRHFLAWAAGNRFPKRLKSISVIMTAAFTQCLFEVDGRDFERLEGSLFRMIKGQMGGCEVYIYAVEGTRRVTERMIRDELPRIDVTGMLRVTILRKLVYPFNNFSLLAFCAISRSSNSVHRGFFS
ncbi:hypothetical protein H2248_008045 [Termitomyces sp. 'cryptogamus']|nr:hypothetical protein H2248_008045 [Termitomyces sp. 'cryptogamus']